MRKEVRFSRLVVYDLRKLWAPRICRGVFNCEISSCFILKLVKIPAQCPRHNDRYAKKKKERYFFNFNKNKYILKKDQDLYENFL